MERLLCGVRTPGNGDAVVYRGWLMKKARALTDTSKVFGKNWKKRYFVLQETAPGEGQKDGALMYQLNYFTNPDGVVQKGCVIIRHGAELLLLETPEERSQAGLREKHGHKPVFALVVKGHGDDFPIFLQALCEGEREKWTSLLAGCLQQLAADHRRRATSKILMRIPTPRKDAHADHEPIAEGLLQKRAVKSGRNFKWRLFRLYASARLVYLAPSGKVEKGILTLNHEFFCSDWTGKKHGFQISDLESTFYLAASSAKEKIFWVGAISGVLRSLGSTETKRADAAQVTFAAGASRRHLPLNDCFEEVQELADHIKRASINGELAGTGPGEDGGEQEDAEELAPTRMKLLFAQSMAFAVAQSQAPRPGEATPPRSEVHRSPKAHPECGSNKNRIGSSFMNSLDSKLLASLSSPGGRPFRAPAPCALPAGGVSLQSAFAAIKKEEEADELVYSSDDDDFISGMHRTAPVPSSDFRKSLASKLHARSVSARAGDAAHGESDPASAPPTAPEIPQDLLAMLKARAGSVTGLGAEASAKAASANQRRADSVPVAIPGTGGHTHAKGDVQDQTMSSTTEPVHAPADMHPSEATGLCDAALAVESTGETTVTPAPQVPEHAATVVYVTASPSKSGEDGVCDGGVPLIADQTTSPGTVSSTVSPSQHPAGNAVTDIGAATNPPSLDVVHLEGEDSTSDGSNVGLNTTLPTLAADDTSADSSLASTTSAPLQCVASEDSSEPAVLGDELETPARSFTGQADPQVGAPAETAGDVPSQNELASEHVEGVVVNADGMAMAEEVMQENDDKNANESDTSSLMQSVPSQELTTETVSASAEVLPHPSEATTGAILEPVDEGVMDVEVAAPIVPSPVEVEASELTESMEVNVSDDISSDQPSMDEQDSNAFLAPNTPDKMHPSAVLPSETCEEQAPIQSATPQTEVLCQQDTTPLQTGIDAAGLVSPPTDFSDLGGKHNLGWSPNDGGGSICSPYEQQEAPAVTAQNDVQELGHDAASEQQQGGKLVAADVQDGENGAEPSPLLQPTDTSNGTPATPFSGNTSSRRQSDIISPGDVALMNLGQETGSQDEIEDNTPQLMQSSPTTPDIQEQAKLHPVVLAIDEAEGTPKRSSGVKKACALLDSEQTSSHGNIGVDSLLSEFVLENGSTTVNNVQSGTTGMLPPKSNTEQRTTVAQEWVHSEIEKLVGVIESKGQNGSGGCAYTTFGTLFEAYQDISDSLVGILIRAKRRGRVFYEGEMLFRGVHDDVRIEVCASA